MRINDAVGVLVGELTKVMNNFLGSQSTPNRVHPYDVPQHGEPEVPLIYYRPGRLVIPVGSAGGHARLRSIPVTIGVVTGCWPDVYKLSEDVVYGVLGNTRGFLSGITQLGDFSLYDSEGAQVLDNEPVICQAMFRGPMIL